MAARLVHTLDRRPDKGQLVILDCTTIVLSLSGSELFGHARGAFTGAGRDRAGAFKLADRGTLFLDEIGELPLAFQSELLSVIQEGMYRPVRPEVVGHLSLVPCPGRCGIAGKAPDSKVAGELGGNGWIVWHGFHSCGVPEADRSSAPRMLSGSTTRLRHGQRPATAGARFASG